MPALSVTENDPVVAKDHLYYIYKHPLLYKGFYILVSYL